MTATLQHTSRINGQIASSHRGRGQGAGDRRRSCSGAAPIDADQPGRLLASYLDELRRARDVVLCAGAGRSHLVIDRDRLTRGDRRLVAHLAADEPSANAHLVCDLYLSDSPGRRCRRLTRRDMICVPPTEMDEQSCLALQLGPAFDDDPLHDTDGHRYQLLPVRARTAIPELRWCKAPMLSSETGKPVSVREVVGALEGYESVRRRTSSAIGRHREDHALSVATLAVELERLNVSRIVLNRGLREAVRATVERGEISMSEIALRCGRVKRDRRGVLSGETTWLARRIGLACDGNAAMPSPWVHTDVLAAIARRGLGIAPREVELG